MNYALLFDERALKEYKDLDDSLREQCKKKLEKILVNPRIEASKLRHPFKDCYKIKLQSVIPPFLGAFKSRGHAACARRCFGV